MELGSGNHIVEYIYDKADGTSSNEPVVQDGIVIQNATDGNEFVWVPIGTIKNDAVKNTTNTKTITLGRYEDFTVAVDGTLPTPAQVASKADYDTPTPINNYIEIANNFAGGTFNGVEYKAAEEYKDKNEKTNEKPLNLQEWISTSLDNGGYYIARYEASKSGVKGVSKATTVDSTSEWNSAKVTDGMLWNNITQLDAAIASRAMYPYSKKAKYYSDLINSYAWDTAVIFIETFSGDTTYADKKGSEINSNIVKTGENADKRCNIQDMAGNVREWTTETYTESAICTVRGGFAGNPYNSTQARSPNNTSLVPATYSFRIILCVE